MWRVTFGLTHRPMIELVEVSELVQVIGRYIVFNNIIWSTFVIMTRMIPSKIVGLPSQ